MLPDITNPYFINLIEQITLIAGQSNYSVILVNTGTAGLRKGGNSVQTEIDAFDNILERQFDGLIIIGGEVDRTNLNSDYVSALNSLNEQLPVVVISQADSRCNCLFVERHIDAGMRLIVQHLLALGHRRIGFLGGQPGIKIADQRIEAFKQALAPYTQVDDRNILANDFYVVDGYRGINSLLNQTDLDAVIAINDQVALGAIRSLHENGLNVPQDIAIGSADMFSDGEYAIPALTTVNQHDQSLGNIAFKQLLHLILNEQVEALVPELPELIMRESCGELMAFRSGDSA